MDDREPGSMPEARGPQGSARGTRRFTAALSEDAARRAALEDVAERRHGAVIPVSGDERLIARSQRRD